MGDGFGEAPSKLGGVVGYASGPHEALGGQRLEPHAALITMTLRSMLVPIGYPYQTLFGEFG